MAGQDQGNVNPAVAAKGAAKQGAVTASMAVEPLPTYKDPTEMDEPTVPTQSPKQGDCVCPIVVTTSSDCLEEYIATQTAEINEGKKAEDYKKILETINKTARESRAKYTQTKYEEFKENWIDQDKEIAELIRKLKCDVHCWQCVLKCHVTPFLKEIYYAEKRLYHYEGHPGRIDNLNELQFWYQQYVGRKQKHYERVESVLKVWMSLFSQVEDALKKNRELIDAATKAIGPETSKVIYDVFMILIPRHLAIASKDLRDKTKIAKDYINPDIGIDMNIDPAVSAADIANYTICCDVYIGKLSLRQRLIGPLPYLIDPNLYLDKICCLVKEGLAPARDFLSDAEKELAKNKDRITANELRLKDWDKKLRDTVKSEMPSTIDCTKYVVPAEKPAGNANDVRPDVDDDMANYNTNRD